MLHDTLQSSGVRLAWAELKQAVASGRTEGEISAETFDVEAFLPDNYAAGSISALSSPVSDAARRRRPPHGHAHADADAGPKPCAAPRSAPGLYARA